MKTAFWPVFVNIANENICSARLSPLLRYNHANLPNTAAFFVNLPVLPTTTEQTFLPKGTERFLKMGAHKQQIFSDLLLVCRCDGRCVIQRLAVKVKLEQAFYQLLNDMLLHFHIDMTVYFGIGADISGVMGKDSSNGFRVALACLDYRFIGE